MNDFPDADAMTAKMLEMNETILRLQKQLQDSCDEQRNDYPEGLECYAHIVLRKENEELRGKIKSLKKMLAYGAEELNKTCGCWEMGCATCDTVLHMEQTAREGSYEKLCEDEARTLRGLAVFTDSATAEHLLRVADRLEEKR